MADQLSRDLASLKINRAEPAAAKSSVAIGKWALYAAFLGLCVVGYPHVRAYVESLVFKTEVDSTEVMLVSAIQSQVDLTATGYVTPQVTAKVGTKNAGRIQKVFVREGDTVKAGQLLFELDPADERSALGSAHARIKAAAALATARKAELEEAQAQLERDEKLANLGATAPASVEDKKLRVQALARQAEAAEADVQVSRAEAHVSGQQLRNLRIFAPVSGTAVAKAAQVGDVVGPATTLVELVDFESLLIEVDVPEARLGQVQRDGFCDLVLDSAPSEHLKCKVVDFTPRVNRAKATATVKVKLVDPAKRLWPDMSARVSFLASEVDEQLRKQPPKKLVAKSALTTLKGQPGVWAIEEKKLNFVPVTSGPEQGQNVELVSGPPPGTRVVSSPRPDFRVGLVVKDKQAISDS